MTSLAGAPLFFGTVPLAALARLPQYDVVLGRHCKDAVIDPASGDESAIS